MFYRKISKIDQTTTLTINVNILQFVHKAKYLGVIVTSDCSDNSDIAQQLSGMYCRSNMPQLFPAGILVSSLSSPLT